MRETCLCSSARPASSTVAHWLQEEPEARTLLALDAPLGWPTDLSCIANHSAGAAIATPRDLMFRRETDRFIKKRLDQQSLDVGADRIARTAHAALSMLEAIRELTAETIPLAWDPSFTARVAAIEVYPAATLRAHGLRFSAYKKPEQVPERREILEALSRVLTIVDPELALTQPDVLDAVVCLLAAFDFQAGKCMSPEHMPSALREGWIWAKSPRDV